MEGGGRGNNAPERRAPRIVHDFDLNVSLEPEEPNQEQLPRNGAPEVVNNPNPQAPASPRVRVIHDLEEENPQVDVLFDISKVGQKNEMGMVVKSNSKYARAGKDLKLQGFKILDDGGINVRLRAENKGSGAGAKKEPSGSRRKRVRSGSSTETDTIGSPGDATSSSTEPDEISGPPKIKWKSHDKEEDAEIHRSFPKERKP